MGLTDRYVTNKRQNELIRKLMALPLLPSSNIMPAFGQLQQQQQQHGNAAIDDLCRYVENTWLVNAMW